MNVALVSREFPPFVGGGIGTYTSHFAHALVSQGHRPTVITVAPDGVESREQSSGVTVVRLPFIRGGDWSRPHPAIENPSTVAVFRAFAPESVFAMQAASALPRLIDELSIDVVEAPDTGALAWFALNQRRTGRPWRSEAPPPLVTVVHSPTAWIAAANDAQPNAALVRMERDSAQWSDALVSPTASLASWARTHWPITPDRVTAIPHPLGTLEPFARAVAAGTAPATPPPRVLFVGRLEPRKGVDTLITAWAHIRGHVLDLVGEDMPDPQDGGAFGASRIARLSPGVRESITLHGRLDPVRVAAMRQLGSVAVVPSPTDNFPYSCVEAMAAGQVVVAARAGGMAELIRDSIDGMMFNPGDALSCADALRRALGLPASSRADIGRAAARRVLHVCGNEAVVSQRIQHVELMRSGASPTPRGAPTDLVCVNGSLAAASVLDRLSQATLQPGMTFAHGWTRVGGGPVIALETPSRDYLSGPPRPLGPLVARAEALAGLALDLAPAKGPGPWKHVRAANTWSVAAALVAEGFVGCVVPECVSVLPARQGARSA